MLKGGATAALLVRKARRSRRMPQAAGAAPRHQEKSPRPSIYEARASVAKDRGLEDEGAMSWACARPRSRRRQRHLGETIEMVIDVAQALVDHAEALEVMAGDVFVGHADAAMELDRLLADEAGGA